MADVGGEWVAKRGWWKNVGFGQGKEKWRVCPWTATPWCYIGRRREETPVEASGEGTRRLVAAAVHASAG